MLLIAAFVILIMFLVVTSHYRKRKHCGERVGHLEKQLPPTWLFNLLNAVFNWLPSLHNKILPPPLAAVNLAGGFLYSRALQVVVKLRVPDHLHTARAPLSIEVLAEKCGARTDRLARILRALTSQGCFQYTRDGLLTNNALSEILRIDHPASVRDFVLHLSGESFWGAEKMYECVVQDATAFPFLLQSGGLDLWQWLSEPGQKEQQETFDRAMVAMSAVHNPPLLVDYPWERHAGQTVVDVGGGTGGFLAQLLTTYPSLRGVLFDRPPVISSARALWSSNHPELLPRVEFKEGSFFEDVPPGNVLFMRHIIHDWNDADATRILQVARRTMAANGACGALPSDKTGAGGAKARAQAFGGPTLILADAILPDKGPTGVVGMMDLQMLNMVDGRERTPQDFKDLLEGAGLKMREVVPTRSALGLVVAELAMPW